MPNAKQERNPMTDAEKLAAIDNILRQWEDIEHCHDPKDAVSGILSAPSSEPKGEAVSVGYREEYVALCVGSSLWEAAISDKGDIDLFLKKHNLIQGQSIKARMTLTPIDGGDDENN